LNPSQGYNPTLPNRRPLQTWGGVFPRTGRTTQAEEPKAATLNAQRAGDIVTRLAQPHMYLPVTGTLSANQQVWSPGPLIEADHRTGMWQMLLPEVDSGCETFGFNDLASVTGWGGGRVDPDGDYVWNLWRPYQCCEHRGQIFLLSVDWLPYPP
jgi:integrating conjugative element protein (TIGR03756 family)